MLIRIEQRSDKDLVYAIHAEAFETSAEAGLVDALRIRARPFISLVAEEGNEVCGHILFTPVTLSGVPELPIVGLAPMAVAPERQNQGLGSALVRTGLDECKRQGFVAVVVLGHPNYYPRFGFQPASKFQLRSEYEVPDEVFMVAELSPGALRGKTGVIRYHEAFRSLGED